MPGITPENMLLLFNAFNKQPNIFCILYDRTGAILATPRLPEHPSEEDRKIRDEARIWDLVWAPYAGDPGPLPKEQFFDGTLFRKPVILNPSSTYFKRFHTPHYAYPYGVPCNTTFFTEGDFFLCALFYNQFFRERALGSLTQDILIFLDNKDQAIICSDLFFRIAPSSEIQIGKIKMEEIADARAWHALLDRDKKALEYMARCEKESRAHPWVAAPPGPLGLTPRNWLEYNLGEWTLTGNEAEVVGETSTNRFLTCLTAVAQDNDIRVNFEYNGQELNGVGVCFFVNIHKAQLDFGFPDADGYNFQVLRQGPEDFRLRLKKFSIIVHDIPLPLHRIIRDGGWDRQKLLFTFERSGGGLFTLYINSEKIASVADTSPIHASKNEFITLLGHNGAHIRNLQIETRVTVFDPARLPPETVDITFHRLPGKFFEARVGFWESPYSARPLKYVYMKDVTYSRDLLAKVNHYVREIDEDLNTAKRIQTQLTRLTLPENPRIRFSCLYRPSGKVGGDMLDIRELDGNRYAALIYDVAGHGIAASLISAMAKMSFDTAFKQTVSPALIMRAVNRDLCTVIDPSMFVTAFLCVADLERMTLTYARAGHCIPAIFPPDNGAPRLLDKGGPILGNTPTFTFEEYAAPLRPGDRTVLYTDGIIEARHREDVFFGTKRLFDLVRETSDLSLPDAQARILSTVQEFSENDKFEDDVALILFDILPVEPGPAA